MNWPAQVRPWQACFSLDSCPSTDGAMFAKHGWDQVACPQWCWGQLAHAEGDEPASPSEALASLFLISWVPWHRRCYVCKTSLLQQRLLPKASSLSVGGSGRAVDSRCMCCPGSDCLWGHAGTVAWLGGLMRHVHRLQGHLNAISIQGCLAGLPGSVGGRGSDGMAPTMPPNLQHWHLLSPVRHKTDALRRLIHALDAQRILVFMNWQSRLKVCPCLQRPIIRTIP